MSEEIRRETERLRERALQLVQEAAIAFEQAAALEKKIQGRNGSKPRKKAQGSTLGSALISRWRPLHL
jgi:hypothetical protein